MSEHEPHRVEEEDRKPYVYINVCMFLDIEKVV